MRHHQGLRPLQSVALVLLLLAALPTLAQRPPKIEDRQFRSQALERSMSYRV